MSHKEIQDFLDAALLFIPYLLVGLITSLVDFFRKHFLQEKFELVKLVVGMISDLWLAGVIALVAGHFSIGEKGTYALIAILVSRGHEWTNKVIDKRLGIDDAKK